MPDPIRSRPRGACALAAVVALVAACAGDRPPPASTATTAPVPHATPGLRTVVEHDVGDGTVTVTVLEVGDDASATMHVSAAGGARVLVAEEVVAGTDHYVHLPAAEAVLGADVWIRFDLGDPRHRAYLAEHPIGLLAHADPAGSGPAGERTVRRERLELPPPIRLPAAAEVVGFEDLHELPDLRLPIGG